MFYASGAAALLALQDPFSAQAAKELPSNNFARTLCSLALTLSPARSCPPKKKALSRFSAPSGRGTAQRSSSRCDVWLSGLAGLVLTTWDWPTGHPMDGFRRPSRNLSLFWAALVAKAGIREEAETLSLFRRCFSLFFYVCMIGSSPSPASLIIAWEL